MENLKKLVENNYIFLNHMFKKMFYLAASHLLAKVVNSSRTAFNPSISCGEIPLVIGLVLYIVWSGPIGCSCRRLL